MPPTIPIEEMRADLAATLRDVDRLTAICTNLEVFIEDSYGENRSAYRGDLLKFRAVLAWRELLKAKIQDELERATNPQPETK